MKARDMILISVDDHICEPSDMSSLRVNVGSGVGGGPRALVPVPARTISTPSASMRSIPVASAGPPTEPCPTSCSLIPVDESRGQLVGEMVAVAKGEVMHPGPFQVQVCVDFPGIAHPAVDLNCVLPACRGGSRGQNPGHRHATSRIIDSSAIDSHPRRVHRSPQDLDSGDHVGTAVLDSLESADRLAELLTLLGVLDCQFGGAGGDPQLQRRRQQCTASAPETGRGGIGDSASLRQFGDRGDGSERIQRMGGTF